MEKMDLVIKNGIIVSSADTYEAEIGIKDGKIVNIGKDLASNAKEVFDAKGNYVFPGGIEPHTHLDMPFGGTFSSDDFETGTKAAAVGGTTTIIDYAIQPKGKTLHETIDMWREKADGKACLDYGLHLAVTDLTDEIIEEIPKVIKEGYPSFKVFMVYDNMMVDDLTFMKVLETASKNGGLISVHAENPSVIKFFTEKLLSEGKTEPKYHAQSRPAFCEGEAANRAISLAKLTKAPLYIVHCSCEESVSEIKKAREEGFPIMGEACPQYLLLSEDNYEEKDFGGAKYVMSPPLRDKKNWEYLWKSLDDGVLQTVATDHCPFFMEQKKMGIDDFTKIPNGAPGIELRMALMYTYGVGKGNISLQDFVKLTSTNASKIFGLYPKKGSIIVGGDADLVVFDPNKEVKVTKGILHENVDYTPYEGFELKGYPRATFSRGQLIAENQEYVGESKRGEFVKRNSPEIL